MKSKALIFILSSLVFFLFCSHSSEKEVWKLVKDKNGIKAFTREITGTDEKQVKVTTNLKTSLSTLTSTLKDVDSHKNWLYNCITAKKIKIISEKEYYYYNLSKAPWPISRRDIVTHALIRQDQRTKIVTFTATGKPNYFKENKGIVRIKRLNSKWVFVPKENGTVDIMFYMSIDVGGTVPTWAVNMAVADGPFQTVKNLKQEIDKGKFKNIKLSFIEEL